MKDPTPEIARIPLEQTGDLRRGVLGWADAEIPLDRSLGARHFGALDAGDSIVGCGSCGIARCPLPDVLGLEAMRFWGVAVVRTHQRRGIGGRIVDEILARASELGVSIIWANARSSALSYYEARGFRVLGDSFTDPLSGLTDRVVLLEAR